MKNILIVDDSMFMRYIIKNILVEYGFSVVGEAENGLLGVEKYRELKPDLVFMDIKMKEMSGTDALKEIMRFDEDARVIMCSSMGQNSIILEALKLGAKDFIVKPFAPEKIIECVQRHSK